MPCWGGPAVVQSSALQSGMDCTVRCDQYVLEMFFAQSTDRIVELLRYTPPADLQPAPKTPPNIITVLRKGSAKRTTYHCRDCARDFILEQDLLQHLTTAKQHQEWFCCPCDKYFLTADAYSTHIYKSPAHLPPLPPPKPFQQPDEESWGRSRTPAGKSRDAWNTKDRKDTAYDSWGGWGRPEPAADQKPPLEPTEATWSAWLQPSPKPQTPVKNAEDPPRRASVNITPAADSWEAWGCKKATGPSWLPWSHRKTSISRGRRDVGTYQSMAPAEDAGGPRRRSMNV